ELVAFNAYVALLVGPLRMLGWMVAVTQRASAAGTRVHEVLSTAPEIVAPSPSRPMPDGGGHIRFRDVTFGYSDGESVLRGLDVDIAAGQRVALVGATASGKSTIAKLIPRFYDVDRGSVEVDGVDVREVDPTVLRSQVGLVFEDTFLFSDTVAANIAFAR